MNSNNSDTQYKSYISGMDQYIEQLKYMEPEKAKEKAKESLIRSGIMDENGKLRKHICD